MNTPLLPAVDAPGILREVAFALLLRDRRPIEIDDLAFVAGLADGGGDLRGSFCTPTVLLCGEEHAADWAEAQGGRGRLLNLAAGARLGGEAWAGCASAAKRLGATMTHEVELLWFQGCANHPA